MSPKQATALVERMAGQRDVALAIAVLSLVLNIVLCGMLVSA